MKKMSQVGFGMSGLVRYVRFGLVGQVGFGMSGWVWYVRLGLACQVKLPWDWYGASSWVW